MPHTVFVLPTSKNDILIVYPKFKLNHILSGLPVKTTALLSVYFKGSLCASVIDYELDPQVIMVTSDLSTSSFGTQHIRHWKCKSKLSFVHKEPMAWVSRAPSIPLSTLCILGAHLVLADFQSQARMKS